MVGSNPETPSPWVDERAVDFLRHDHGSHVVLRICCKIQDNRFSCRSADSSICLWPVGFDWASEVTAIKVCAVSGGVWCCSATLWPTGELYGNSSPPLCGDQFHETLNSSYAVRVAYHATIACKHRCKYPVGFRLYCGCSDRRHRH